MISFIYAGILTHGRHKCVTTCLLANFWQDILTLTMKQCYSTLETMGIQLHRTSMDKHTNDNGYRLVEICKNNNLTILNGRFGQDKGIGRMTFRNSSWTMQFPPSKACPS